MANNILEMKNITKEFFGNVVLKGVNLEIQKGEVHILAGENGAGKSTLMKILSGAYKLDSGEIILNNEKLEHLTPISALKKGISVIYQEFNLIPYLSIFENIFLGKEYKKGLKIDTKREIQEAQILMKKVGLEVKATTLVHELSVAQKQLVEIVKAISNEVKILVLDEPTASITDKETKMLFSIIKDLKKENIGIIYISHRMDEFFEIGDRCTVMRDGSYIGTVNICDTNEAEITKMLVGRDVEFQRLHNEVVDYSKTVLSVRNLFYKKLLKDINFDLYKGEILGFAGLVGSGRTEIAKCIISDYKKTSGEIFFNDEVMSSRLDKNIANGIVYLSEDRKDEGLILMHNVVENINLPNLKQVANPFINTSMMSKKSKQYVKDLNIKGGSINQNVVNLSGGNQQKVVIAKWLYSNASIYIFDEPTRGIDVGAREEIYNIMYDLIKNGASIILISSDLVEIQKMSDRILVMKEGQISSIIKNSDSLTQEQIMESAL